MSQRILLIDDDPDIREVLSRGLERAGFEVAVAEDGRDGLSLVEERAFDLVVTDIFMPDIEGIGTILSLRKSHPDLPVIAMSGGGRVTNKDFLPAAERLGAKRVMQKPFLPSDLVDAVRSVLGKSVEKKSG